MREAAGSLESWKSKLKKAIEELRAAYAHIYPHHGSDISIGLGLTKADHEALRRTDELTFSLWFINETPRLTVSNPHAIHQGEYKEYSPMLTLSGHETEKVFKRLSAEARLTLIENAEKTNGGIGITEGSPYENNIDKLIKKLKWRWSQEPEAN